MIGSNVQCLSGHKRVVVSRQAVCNVVSLLVVAATGAEQRSRGHPDIRFWIVGSASDNLIFIFIVYSVYISYYTSVCSAVQVLRWPTAATDPARDNAERSAGETISAAHTNIHQPMICDLASQGPEKLTLSIVRY